MPNTYITAALLNTRLDDKLNQYLDIPAASDPTTDPRLVALVADVNATIDDHLRSKYNLPLASVPESIIRAGLDIATYWLLTRIKKSQLHEADETTFRDAMKYLLNLSKGRSGVTLDTAERNASSKSRGLLLGDLVTAQDQQRATGEPWFPRW